ncbi:MAG: hydrogenase maturation peptidase HycI [candidate division WOR-3 bacterium]
MKKSQTLILAIGNRMRGDDAIGCVIADELKRIDGLLVIDAGTVPENFIEKICELKPKRIIIVDACDFKGQPGTFRIFSERQMEKITGHLISTHTLSLNLTVAMIKKQLDCRVQLLGIQPERIDFGTALSPKVNQAKDRVVKYLLGLVTKT